MTKRRSRLSESLAPYLASKSSGVTKLSISLSTDLAEDVRRTAEERGTTVSATMAAALRKAQDSEDPPTPEDLLRGLLPAREWIGLIALAMIRKQSLEELLLEVVNPWLKAQGMLLDRDEALRTLAEFRVAQDVFVKQQGWTAEEIQADVDEAVAEVRAARAARRR